MRTTLIARGAAVAAAAAMVALSAAPASAATVSQASATALSLEVAGTGATDTGTYSVTHDGSTESSKGVNEPVLTALGGQKALQAGTLAQNAVAKGNATSAACSGVAGDGATLVAVGDGDCLKGGNNLSLDVGSLDFSNVKVIQSEMFMGVDDQVQGQLKPFQAQIADGLRELLAPLVEALGSPGLYLDLGAVQSSCTANAKAANGDSTITNAKAYANVPGAGRVDLVDLPVEPAVNQKVVTDLSGVVDAVLAALKTQLTKGLGGALADIDPIVTQLQAQLLEPLLTSIEEQLAPLEENVLDITLNAQDRSPGAISVTALDAEVLPAARAFVGSSLAHLTIGTSNCGPNSPAEKAAPHAPQKNPPAEAPATVPTVVTAGMESYDDGSAGRIALVAMLLLAAGGAGAAAYVRTLRRG
ncbi:hypothetical protein FB381_4013 [Nocardioides albertanoniae]|uniref:Choice-of-anchor G family protein n=1 Tax=Nocardioides albertanoniae TaxID=1175486 RepID=A0A543ABZ9_9ACTN|nr:hypothetical protein [Nocardioides albertanoniae]TQL70087.1 hypothetical protein FB381_4013 [Nocardioides albertanoniae]